MFRRGGDVPGGMAVEQVLVQSPETLELLGVPTVLATPIE